MLWNPHLSPPPSSLLLCFDLELLLSELFCNPWTCFWKVKRCRKQGLPVFLGSNAAGQRPKHFQVPRWWWPCSPWQGQNSKWFLRFAGLPGPYGRFQGWLQWVLSTSSQDGGQSVLVKQQELQQGGSNLCPNYSFNYCIPSSFRKTFRWLTTHTGCFWWPTLSPSFTVNSEPAEQIPTLPAFGRARWSPATAARDRLMVF